MTYALVEPFMVTWHTAKSLTGRACTELPADMTTLPVTQYQRVGGVDVTLTLDEATISVDCYASTRAGAYTLAEQIRTALRTTAYTASGVVIARVRTISAPAARPYDNTALRRVGATYLVTLHSAP